MKKDKTVEDGFSSLIDSYIVALQDNSREIEDMLKSLKGRKLSKTEKQMLNKFKRDLEKVDKTLDKIGD